MSDKKVIPKEMAEEEFSRFTEAMRIDMDFEGLDANDRRDKEADRTAFLKAVMRGCLSVDDDGHAVFTPLEGESIEFHKATGAALLAMDKKKSSSDVAKAFAALAAITRKPEITFAKMDMADLKICLAVQSLFLA